MSRKFTNGETGLMLPAEGFEKLNSLIIFILKQSL